MTTILLISPYWKEPHRWMVSSVKLAELWQRMGYRVIVVCMGAETSKEDVSSTLTIYRVRDLFLPDPFNYGIAPTLLFHVLRAIRKEKPDLLIVNKVLFWSSLVIPILRLMGKKPILLTDALVGMTWWPRGFLPKIMMAIGAWTAGWIVLLSASKIVFFHPQPETLLKILGIAKKSQVIPTGIDETKYRRPAGSLPAGQAGGQRSAIVVTYIGRMESVKGVDDFLASASPLKKEFPSVQIQIVGWYKKNHPLVSQYASDANFLGLRNDISDILAKTDIFVLPSYSEGLSNALMEAMASSCACIATNVGGNRFLIEDGISGFLYVPGDREALQEHLRTLITDGELREVLGEDARKRIERVFSWQTVEQKYATLFADAKKRVAI
jgi:glycosyltransferase involved in cell wall biosynthesis